MDTSIKIVDYIDLLTTKKKKTYEEEEKNKTFYKELKELSLKYNIKTYPSLRR